MKTTDDIRASVLRGLRLLLLILAPLAPTQAASPALEGAVPPANFKVQNKVLGKVPLLGDPRSIVDSDDGQHIAFVVRRGLKSTVWYDGAEGTPYQRISRLMFSPAGSHLAYIASKSADSEVVVLDGKELATHWSISTNSLQFSPNGNRIAYVVAAPTNRAVTTHPVPAWSMANRTGSARSFRYRSWLTDSPDASIPASTLAHWCLARTANTSLTSRRLPLRATRA